MKKTLAMTLAAIMVFSLVLSGCGGEDSSATTTAEAGTTVTTQASEAATTVAGGTDAQTVDIHWWSSSGAPNQDDWTLVQEEFQRMYLEDLNVNMNFHFFLSSEYNQKATAALNAGQEMDIVHTSTSLVNYVTHQKAGAFTALDELLPVYAPNTWEQIPDYVWDGARIDGKIYAMPTYKDMSVDMGFIYNQTMAQELGIEEKIINSGYTYGKDLDQLFYEARELRDAAHPEWAPHYLISHRQDMHIYYHADTLLSVASTAIDGSFLGDPGLEDGTTVFNVYETNEYADAIKLITRWTEDGIFPYDAQNADPDGAIKKSGSSLGNFTWGTAVVNANQYENFDQAMIHPTHSFTYTGYIQAVMQAVASHSEHPEIAVQCMELLFSDPDYATTFRFGVEGTHWNKKEVDGEIRADFEGTKNDQANSADRPYYLWYHAEAGNLFNTYLPTDLADNFYEELDKMNANAIASVNMGFVANSDPVANEVAACSGVISEYHDTLKYGMVTDVDSMIGAFVEKLNANGADKIVAEMQSQLDAWRG